MCLRSVLYEHVSEQTVPAGAGADDRVGVLHSSTCRKLAPAIARASSLMAFSMLQLADGCTVCHAFKVLACKQV